MRFQVCDEAHAAMLRPPPVDEDADSPTAGLFVAGVCAAVLSLTRDFSRHGVGKTVTSVISPPKRPQTRMDAGFHGLQLFVIHRNSDYTPLLSPCFHWS